MNLMMFIANVLSCTAWATVAFAQGDPPYPSRTVRLVVATTAGTTADVLARVLADRTSVLWRQSVVVENRPGVAGITSVASASPDGHALLVTANGHAAAGALHKDLPLDPVKDLVGAAQIGHVPLVLVVPLELPVQNLRDLIAFAKARPGAVNFASAGLGSTSHLAGEVFKRAADVNIQHVPYRGAESLTSIMRGDTQMTIIPVSTALDLINSKKLRAIAVISPERIPSLPEVPTFSESGLSDFTYNAWFGVLAPASTPKGILAEIGRATESVLKQSDIQTALTQQGVNIAFSPSDPFDRVMKADAVRFGQLLSK
jgi:tripartite-type tricarboxylate transporter receptor subunit TctC